MRSFLPVQVWEASLRILEVWAGGNQGGAAGNPIHTLAWMANGRRGRRQRSGVGIYLLVEASETWRKTDPETGTQIIPHPPVGGIPARPNSILLKRYVQTEFLSSTLFTLSLLLCPSLPPSSYMAQGHRVVRANLLH